MKSAAVSTSSITLLHLRHLLDEGVAPGSHLTVTRDTLSLDFTSAITLDLHTLHDAWTVAHTSARTAPHLPEDAHRTLLARLQHAASLSRGMFLEGFALRGAPAFDDWLRLQRDSWHVRVNEIFARLSYLQFEAGALAPAMETVKRWLVLDPLHEDAYQRLMRLHFAAGDRGEALHAYDACREMLSTHLQTKPVPETVALANRMRAVAPPPRKEEPLPALSPEALLDGPLLGRTAELSTLIRPYHATQRGSTQVVLLEGEVGIGKTRLATEFLTWADIEGADVLRLARARSGDDTPHIGDRASLHTVGASVRTQCRPGKGPGSLYLDARVCSQFLPPRARKRRNGPPGASGRPIIWKQGPLHPHLLRNSRFSAPGCCYAQHLLGKPFESQARRRGINIAFC